jgi:hypothetical protein
MMDAAKERLQKCARVEEHRVAAKNAGSDRAGVPGMA